MLCHFVSHIWHKLWEHFNFVGNSVTFEFFRFWCCRKRKYSILLLLLVVKDIYFLSSTFLFVKQNIVLCFWETYLYNMIIVEYSRLSQ